MAAPRLDRRLFLISASAALLGPGCAQAAPARALTVYKTPWCGCCGGWVTHMTRAGFRVSVVEREDLAPVRKQYGVPFELSSCHTGVSGGYVLEGHVPADAVKRLLTERPPAKGLAVPGMPMGSPGMEMADMAPETFEVILFGPEGRRTYARYEGSRSL